MNNYVLGIDQSTQGTKAMILTAQGSLLSCEQLPHRQIVNECGWVEHDPEEIYRNTVSAVKKAVLSAGIAPEELCAVGISNQRETAMAWDRTDGTPVCNAVVWQCARGSGICESLNFAAQTVREKTGMPLSPYFSAAKLAWILRNIPRAAQLATRGALCCGTMDSWLVYRLTHGRSFRTDFSNASRTQLMNIQKLCWDGELCELFGIPADSLAEITDSDGFYGETDFEGLLPGPIPIHGVLGDSHSALFAQGCVERGMVKATYGTGSSVMMNIGTDPAYSRHVVTSLAWRMSGKTEYVLEGNINYTGAVITWLRDSLCMIRDPDETAALASAANPEDTTYLVPAFSGLGAPFWDSGARAAWLGMSRVTGRAELVKAALESIAYQIRDVLLQMEKESGITLSELRVDGGPTRNLYLMQFQSDIAGIPVRIPRAAELSGIGAAYAAGLGIGLYQREQLFPMPASRQFTPAMPSAVRARKYAGWQTAVRSVLSGT